MDMALHPGSSFAISACTQGPKIESSQDETRGLEQRTCSLWSLSDVPTLHAVVLASEQSPW